MTWSATSARHAIDGGRLCVAWGAPRGGDAAGGAIAPRLDTPSLLRRIATDGEAAFARTAGGFGVVYVDLTAQRAMLAVDRFSAETLCHGVERGSLCFSDRADTVPLDRRTLDAQSIYDLLYFHCIPAPRTIFAEVKRLGRGSYLELRDGALHERPHWTPRFDESASAPFAGLRREFRGLVGDAVREETLHEDTLGCFLSGGTDSSTIAGMLGQATGRPARSYSIGFDAPGYDEMEYARIAARHFGTEHREYYVTAADIVHSVPRVAAFLDQPFGNSSIVPAFYCAQMAQADGVTRMLAGDGGDELFGGNTRYRLQQFLNAYDSAPIWLRTRIVEPAFKRWLGDVGVPGIRHVAAYVRHATTPMPDRMESFNLLHRIGARRILDPAWLTAVDEQAPLQAQRAIYEEAPARDIVNRMLYYDWKFTLADNDLVKVRTSIQMNGLSVGYPLLADELVNFSLRLPPAFKVRHGRLRWFFKKALRGFLPEQTLRKKKHGFGLPFGVWVTEHRPLLELAADSLADLERRGVLHKGFRDGLLQNDLPAHPGYYGEMLWILMMLEQWLHARQPLLEREVSSLRPAAQPI